MSGSQQRQPPAPERGRNRHAPKPVAKTDRRPALAARFLARLGSAVPLSASDREALLGLCTDIRELPADRHIARQGEKPRHVHVVLDGWAARYEILGNGARQITAFLLPGDLGDQHVTILDAMDHGICTLTPASVAFLPNGALDDIARRRPAIARALQWSTLVDEAVLRAWIVSVARREAYGTISHLLCELHARMANVGRVRDDCFNLPLTQDEIADAVGLTPVHVNRTLKRLRADGLIRLSRGLLAIPDVPKLRAAAGFNPAYLHCGSGRRAAAPAQSYS